MNDIAMPAPWPAASEAGPRPPTSEFDLMTRAREGDPEAFGRLFRRHADSIWRIGYLLLHCSSGADDVVQETFVRGLEHAAAFRAECAPKAWLCSIALNVCRRQLRDRQWSEQPAPPSTLEAGRSWGGAATGVMTAVLRREQSVRLALALGFLTDSQREVFVLHYVEGLPYGEVAKLTGISEGAARALAHRARALLREKLGPYLSK